MNCCDIIPSTAGETIIFPITFKLKSYDSSFYSPSLTEGRLTKQEIDQVLQEVETIRRPHVQRMYRWAFLIFIIYLVCFTGFIFVIVKNRRKAVPTFTAMAIFCFIGTVLMMIIRRHVMNSNRLSRDQVQAALYRINQRFINRGLRWRLPDKFPRWIELYKEYSDPSSRHPNNRAQVYGNYEAPQQFGDYQFQEHQQYYSINDNNNYGAYNPPQSYAG